MLAPERDRDLIRALARRLAENDAAAAQLRIDAGRTMSGDPPMRGGILAALRRSPLVGTELNLGREDGAGRDVEL